MADAPEETRPLAGKHALLLESGGERRALQAALNESGATVHVRAREASALAALATAPIDLILIDLSGPGHPGLTFALRLARRGAAHPPIAAIGRPQDRAVALAAGACAFLELPLARGEVGRALGAIFRREGGEACAHAPEPSAEVGGVLLGALLEQHDELRRHAEALQAQLDRMMNLRHDLLHAIAYELAAPFTPVAGYLQILQSERLGELNDRQRRVLASIAQSSARMVRTIDAITEFASLETNQYWPASEKVQPRPFLEKVVDLVRFSIAKPKHVLLRLVIRDSAPECVVTDARRLGQIVRALIETAVIRSPSGACVLIEAASAGEQLRISIYDQAAAPPEEERARMLDPFIPRPRSGRFIFTELELPIANKLADVLGGRLILEAPPARQPDPRARFLGLVQTIELPLRAHAAPGPEGHAARIDGAAKPWTEGGPSRGMP